MNRLRPRVACRAMLALLIGLLACAALATRAAASPIKVSVDRGTLTSPLPGGFLGLALEYRTIPGWVGTATSASGVDPVLLALVRNLDPTGRPSIRIGGQSTDRSWWPVPGVAQPVGVTYALTPAWAADARSLAQALDARLILSTNFEADSPALSRYEAQQLLAAIGSRYVDDLEIGNEPDLYTTTPWYRVLHGQDVPWYDQTGVPVFARPVGYNVASFTAQYPKFLAAMPHVPIAGPDAVSASWLTPFDRLVSRHGRIGMLDSHAYALQNCVTDPTSPVYPTIPNLLSVRAWQHLLNGAEPSVALAHHDGLQFRIDEMGSVTCNGHTGVSNTMAAALWVTNGLFFAARQGVDGVNLHSQPGSSNGLFDLAPAAGGYSAQIHPIYDGALMFARADPVGARQLALTSDGPPAVQSWATIGADHQVRVLIDNEAGPRRVTIHAPRGFGVRSGSVQRLIAPSVSATSGLTIGGRAFDTTQTGAAPAPQLQAVRPRSGGYTVAAPGGSETLVTLRYKTRPKPAAKPTGTPPKPG